jgi:hypothetical protein
VPELLVSPEPEALPELLRFIGRRITFIAFVSKR